MSCHVDIVTGWLQGKVSALVACFGSYAYYCSLLPAILALKLGV